MELSLIATLLGVILTSIITQTAAVWIKVGNLEKKLDTNRCPFGKCPLYERAKSEAVEDRRVIKDVE